MRNDVLKSFESGETVQKHAPFCRAACHSNDMHTVGLLGDRLPVGIEPVTLCPSTCDSPGNRGSGVASSSLCTAAISPSLSYTNSMCNTPLSLQEAEEQTQCAHAAC